MSQLFAPVCSITTTKRRRFFWAAWWSGPPVRVPFKKPDAEGGGAGSREEALAMAESRAGMSLSLIDPLWARAWMRILRGQHPWPSKASREPAGAGAVHPQAEGSGAEAGSIWSLLGVTREVTESELKAAYRRRALETHPDHGGDEATFRRVVQAYEEAQRRLRKPRARKRASSSRARGRD